MMQLSTKGNGSSMKLTASVVGTKKNVTWTTSDKNIAVVKGGKVTGKGNGTTTITATANNVSTTCTVTVLKGNVSIHTEKELLYTGEEKKLKTNAGKKEVVIWSSSDENVVFVDQSGKITAKGAGTAIITASLNNTKDTCEITVKDTTTSIKEEKLLLTSEQIKSTYDLEYEVVGRKSTVKWETSDKKIPTVSKGKITAKKSGTVIIRATANGVSDSVEVNISLKESAVRLNQSEYTLYTKKGNTYTLKATIEGTVKKVNWESSNPQAAIVNTKGK